MSDLSDRLTEADIDILAAIQADVRKRLREAADTGHDHAQG